MNRLISRMLGAGVSLTATATLLGCSDGPEPYPLVEATPPSVVQAVVGNLTPVLTVDGSISAVNEYTLVAGRSGDARLLLKPGSALQPGAVLATFGGAQLVSKSAGTVKSWQVTDGQSVPSGFPVVTIAVPTFQIRATVPRDRAYRVLSGPVTARAQAVGGPAPFACELVGNAGQAAETTSAASPGDPAIACLVPPSVAVQDGMPATLAIASLARQSVTLLPLRAVAGRSGSGLVTQVSGDGTVRDVAVKLGATDGVNIEIVSGIKAGDKVYALAPSLRPSLGRS